MSKHIDISLHVDDSRLMNGLTSAHDAIEKYDVITWALDQMQGVMPETHPQFHIEKQMMGLIYMDYLAMESAEKGVTYIHWPSEFDPFSYSWLI